MPGGMGQGSIGSNTGLVLVGGLLHSSFGGASSASVATFGVGGLWTSASPGPPVGHTTATTVAHATGLRRRRRRSPSWCSSVTFTPPGTVVSLVSAISVVSLVSLVSVLPPVLVLFVKHIFLLRFRRRRPSGAGARGSGRRKNVPRMVCQTTRVPCLDSFVSGIPSIPCIRPSSMFVLFVLSALSKCFFHRQCCATNTVGRGVGQLFLPNPVFFHGVVVFLPGVRLQPTHQVFSLHNALGQFGFAFVQYFHHERAQLSIGAHDFGLFFNQFGFNVQLRVDGGFRALQFALRTHQFVLHFFYLLGTQRQSFFQSFYGVAVVVVVVVLRRRTLGHALPQGRSRGRSRRGGTSSPGRVPRFLKPCADARTFMNPRGDFRPRQTRQTRLQTHDLRPQQTVLFAQPTFNQIALPPTEVCHGRFHGRDASDPGRQQPIQILLISGLIAAPPARSKQFRIFQQRVFFQGTTVNQIHGGRQFVLQGDHQHTQQRRRQHVDSSSSQQRVVCKALFPKPQFFVGSFGIVHVVQNAAHGAVRTQHLVDGMFFVLVGVVKRGQTTNP